jgi:laminin alpha 3/5
MKTRHVLALRVDGSLNEPTVGPGTKAFTDTNNPLYIGGHPNINSAKGIKSRKPFVGCMKNIIIHKKSANLITNNIYGNVTIGSCFVS